MSLGGSGLSPQIEILSVLKSFQLPRTAESLWCITERNYDFQFTCIPCVDQRILKGKVRFDTYILEFFFQPFIDRIAELQVLRWHTHIISCEWRVLEHPNHGA